MPKINPGKTAERYNSINTIVDDDDIWHQHTQNQIFNFIHQSINTNSLDEEFKILNVGSAGFSYGLNENNIVHLDLADKHLIHLKNSFVGDAENMPKFGQKFDLIICVGSVLNYCDPIRVINQFSENLKDNGALILEFENSYTFELLFKKNFNNTIVFTETFFDVHGDTEKLWYFSEKFIKNLLTSYDFQIISKKRFHIISPLILRITNDINYSARFIRFDKICSKIPFLNKFSSNIIYLASRKI